MREPKPLADVPGVGRIYRCMNCDDIHVGIGPVEIRIPEHALEGVALLVTQALDSCQSQAYEETIPVQRGVSWSAHRWPLS